VSSGRATGHLYLKNTNATGFADVQINYGLPGDKPVVGDWDNDGTDTIGIYRNGTFHAAQLQHQSALPRSSSTWASRPTCPSPATGTASRKGELSSNFCFQLFQ
jgi:hypothetical protein